MTGYQDGLAAGFLAELRADPVRAIEGIELTLSQHRGDSSAVWAKLAMSMSEDHRRAEPDDPSAPAWCDYCGATTGLAEHDELGTGDRPCACHGAITRPCADTDACVRRREERYPPDLARVPLWVITAGSEAAAAADVARLVRLAAGQAAGEYLELAAPDTSALAPHQQELARLVAARQDDYALHGAPAGNQLGAYDTRGGYHPVNFNWSHWAHTIRGGAHHGHLISGGARWGATAATASAAVLAARQAQVAQGGAQSAQEASGGQGGTVPGSGQGAPQAAGYGVPAGAHAGQEGGDRPLGQVEAMAQVRTPEGPPRAAPGRGRGTPRRRGRRLAYSAGRRQVVRKPAQHPPSDSGWGSAGEGPSGGSAET